MNEDRVLVSRSVLADYAETITHLRRRNQSLSSRVSKLVRERDKHRENAALWRNRHRQLKFARRKRASSPPRTFTQEDWRQHDLIVARIRAIPNRPS